MVDTIIAKIQTTVTSLNTVNDTMVPNSNTTITSVKAIEATVNTIVVMITGRVNTIVYIVARINTIVVRVRSNTISEGYNRVDNRIANNAKKNRLDNRKPVI